MGEKADQVRALREAKFGTPKPKPTELKRASDVRGRPKKDRPWIAAGMSRATWYRKR